MASEAVMTPGPQHLSPRAADLLRGGPSLPLSPSLRVKFTQSEACGPRSPGHPYLPPAHIGPGMGAPWGSGLEGLPGSPSSPWDTRCGPGVGADCPLGGLGVQSHVRSSPAHPDLGFESRCCLALFHVLGTPLPLCHQVSPLTRGTETRSS